MSTTSTTSTTGTDTMSTTNTAAGSTAAGNGATSSVPSETGTAGLTFTRVFSTEGVSPYDQVTWETRTTEILGKDGTPVFRQEGVEVPASWSDRATAIVFDKYAYGRLGTEEREGSVRDIISRVVMSITAFGEKHGYFASHQDWTAFADDLTWLLLNQYSAFNSPVWFNVGCRPGTGYAWDFARGNVAACSEINEPRYTGSACFILGVKDSIGTVDGADSAGSISRNVAAEMAIFKDGSGAGSDRSRLRSSREPITGGGYASGPVSFMRIYDAAGAVTKSGGRCLAADQPVFTAGGVKTAKELADAGTEFICLSWSERLGRFAAKIAQAWRSGRKPVVTIVTDKGEFRVSSDHYLMLRDGRACRACDLKPGMSLHPSAPIVSKGYVKVRVARGRGASKDMFHRLLAMDILGWDIAGKHVHHDDENRLNSVPGNLVLMTPTEHHRLHNCNRVERGEHTFQVNRYPHDGEHNGMHSGSAFWRDEVKVATYKEKQASILRGRDPRSLQKVSSRQKMLNTGYSLINAGHNVSTFDGYYEARKVVIGKIGNSKAQLLEKFQNQFGGYENFYAELRADNHRVLGVVSQGIEDVYSIEVDDLEPDDKRPWSEHNYTLAPIGTTYPHFSGILSLNTRRAAKMEILRCDHPDIMEFINCKRLEEKKAKALIAAGYEADFNGEAYNSVLFQNSNLSVRATDDFLRAVEAGSDWQTIAVATGRPEAADGTRMPSFNAAELMDAIAEGTWQCGDPGLQYDSTIQRWHTTPNAGRIWATNPCLRKGTRLCCRYRGSWTSMPVEELAQSDPSDYEIFDGFQCVKGKVWRTGVKKVVRLHLDNGSYLDLTPDHKVYAVGYGRHVAAWLPAAEMAGKRYVTTVNGVAGDESRLGLVESVEDLGIEDDVYDFSVPTTNCGFANRVLVHNCSEYVNIDDSACNLASLNLMKFRRPDGTFDAPRFRAAVRVFTVAQDILVDQGSYPTPEIARNAHRFRQLGLGYTNLGSLIMAAGLPYDSDEGRSLAGAITAILTGQAYLTSAEMAGTAGLGAFDGFAADRENMLRVMGQHRDAAWDLRICYPSPSIQYLYNEASSIWDEVVSVGEQHGYRNSQATVLAPTGTIALMMDCSTTGVEPSIALVSYKTLWGRGRLKLVNDTVPEALRTLGYYDGTKHNQPDVVKAIVEFIGQHDTIEGCPLLHQSDLPVFDCAFPPANGSRSIHWQGHVKMMAACQPFISGAISKTVNMPRDATVADIRAAYLEGWRLGLKALAIYRDGSKESQPVSAGNGGTHEDGQAIQDSVVHSGADRVFPGQPDRGVDQSVVVATPRRTRLPDTRPSVTHKLSVGGVEAYLTVGHYSDGRPGELFVEIAKQGSTVGGLMDAWATMVSIALQYGVPVEVIASKFSGGRFEPSGITRNPDIPFATSLIDYIARWLGTQYVSGYREQHVPRRDGIGIEGHGAAVPAIHDNEVSVPRTNGLSAPAPVALLIAHAPVCGTCGGLCQPAGACWVCGQCGTTTGGCS